MNCQLVRPAIAGFPGAQQQRSPRKSDVAMARNAAFTEEEMDQLDALTDNIFNAPEGQFLG